MAGDEHVPGYDPNDITLLQGLSSVRERPGMYVGDARDGSGLHQLLWEVLANALDEHLGGHATRVHVRIEDGFVEVEDDGRGIPLTVGPSSGKSLLEEVLTTLHHTATWDGHVPHVHISAGFHGVGLFAVNALSERFEVETRNEGRAWRIGLARGEVVAPLDDVGSTDARGTLIRFRPDPEIFTRLELDEELIYDRMHELAYLLPQLKLTFQGRGLHEPDGLSAWVEAAARRDGAAPDVLVRASGERGGVLVDVAAAWTRGAAGSFWSYVGLAPTSMGGTHVKGFWDGVRRAITAAEPSASTADLERRLGSAYIVLHASLFHPRFGGPTREHLLSSEAREAVREVVADALAAEPETVHALVRRLSAARDAR